MEERKEVKIEEYGRMGTGEKRQISGLKVKKTIETMQKAANYLSDSVSHKLMIGAYYRSKYAFSAFTEAGN